jgi:hypothetical protein
MMRRLVMIVAAAAAIGSLGAGKSAAQAPNAMVAQYGYPFCAIVGGGPDIVIHDCYYSNMDQCQASASAQGYCVENPAYIAAGLKAAPVPAATPRHIRRKHRH